MEEKNVALQQALFWEKWYMLFWHWHVDIDIFCHLELRKMLNFSSQLGALFFFHTTTKLAITAIRSSAASQTLICWAVSCPFLLSELRWLTFWIKNNLLCQFDRTLPVLYMGDFITLVHHWTVLLLQGFLLNTSELEKHKEVRGREWKVSVCVCVCVCVCVL